MFVFVLSPNRPRQFEFLKFILLVSSSSKPVSSSSKWRNGDLRLHTLAKLQAETILVLETDLTHLVIEAGLVMVQIEEWRSSSSYSRRTPGRDNLSS